MSNETLFYICGIALAVSAVLVSMVGLKVKDFPGRALPVVIVWFAVLVGASTTFAVLHAKDEEKAKAAAFEQEGKEVEKGQAGGPYEEAEEGAEGGETEQEEAQAGELGAQVFASNGCGGCHTFKAADSTGTTGPDLNEYLATDDDKAAIREMIVNPDAEIAESYPANIMPQSYGQSLDSEELQELIDFLYRNSPAGEGK